MPGMNSKDRRQLRRACLQPDAGQYTGASQAPCVALAAAAAPSCIEADWLLKEVISDGGLPAPTTGQVRRGGIGSQKRRAARRAHLQPDQKESLGCQSATSATSTSASSAGSASSLASDSDSEVLDGLFSMLGEPVKVAVKCALPAVCPVKIDMADLATKFVGI